MGEDKKSGLNDPMKKYVLNAKHEPEEITDVLEWARRFESEDRRVGEHWVGSYRVSTVFLGIDHSFGFSEGPVLFETMVFDTSKPKKVKIADVEFTAYPDLDQRRYRTWDEAVHGHFEVINELSKKVGK